MRVRSDAVASRTISHITTVDTECNILDAAASMDSSSEYLSSDTESINF